MGLTFRSEVARGLNENRHGLPAYSGSALGQIEDDHFRDAKLVELASKVVALTIAIDIGVDDIAAVGGIIQLVSAIEDHVSQLKDDEAQELFAIGS